MYYPYDESFAFSVEETPDIITPDNMSAYGYEDRIEVSWAPIPVGCGVEDEETRSTSSASNNSPFKYKPGPNARHHIVGKIRERLNTQRSNSPGPTHTRDCEDGTVNVTFSMSGGNYPSEITWDIVDADNDLVLSGDFYTVAEICLEYGTYTAMGYDSWGDGWGGGILAGTTDDGTVVLSLTVSGSSGSQSFTLCPGGCVYGCTDPDAQNYNQAANADDGSCTYPGYACATAIVIADPEVGVTDRAETWFSIDLPADISDFRKSDLLS